MIDGSETVAHENGRDMGYTEGFCAAIEAIQRKIQTYVNENIKDVQYQYIPYARIQAMLTALSNQCCSNASIFEDVTEDT